MRVLLCLRRFVSCVLQFLPGRIWLLCNPTVFRKFFFRITPRKFELFEKNRIVLVVQAYISNAKVAQFFSATFRKCTMQDRAVNPTLESTHFYRNFCYTWRCLFERILDCFGKCFACALDSSFRCVFPTSFLNLTFVWSTLPSELSTRKCKVPRALG